MLNRNPKPRPKRWIKKHEFKKLPKRKKLESQWGNDYLTVKALRKFVNGFGAKDGYHLEAVKTGKLSSAKKAKIRRYLDKYRAEVVSINAGHYVLKHYRKRQNLRDAVRVSQQESPAGKDQRNAVFYTPDPENFSVRLRRGKGFKGESRFVIKNKLFTMDRIRFDSPDFLDLLQKAIDAQHKEQRKRGRARRIHDWTDVLADQPELIIDAALALLPDRERFSILTGKYSTEPVRADEFLAYFRDKIMQYTDEDTGELFHEIDFLTGIQALD